ncbi:MAG: late competence development ComFB family protein [Lachnoclostridium sp.]|jgi:competence protein ComFB|nr:late competence development ComFB family protein [Lachnoclostridium sp.]
MEYELHNLMETIIADRYDKMKNEYAQCQCEQCELDIKAFALNRLPSKYFVSEKGALFAKLDFLTIEFEAMITTELMLAFETIGSKPRHN